MTEPRSSLPPAYFDALYRANPDPWSFETSPYEHAKYAATVAALPKRRYRAGLELGCSIGVLTERLAARCEQLLSLDVSEQALARARARLADQAHVRFERRFLPEEFPEGSFDLIVLSEVGYYFSLSDLARLRASIVTQLEPGGHLILVHWTPFVADYPLTGDQVHAAFLSDSAAGLRHHTGLRDEQFRLDLFERAAHND
jgi:predicted TPR repeat methyltransferase